MGVVTKNSSSSTFDGMDLSVNHRRSISGDFSILENSTQLLRHPILESGANIILEADSELFLL